jgi:hypothetical protein
LSWPEITRDTVLPLTPASRATSDSVARLNGPELPAVPCTLSTAAKPTSEARHVIDGQSNSYIAAQST